MEQTAQSIMGQIALEHLTDEEIAELAKNGNVEALEYLINKYKNFVRAKARTYFLIGADREDIIQEGMIGLYKAIRDYRCDRQASFRAFAEDLRNAANHYGYKNGHPAEAHSVELLYFPE